MIKIKLNSFTALDEGRVDDMKKKYPGKDDIIDQLSKAPGNNKYLDWMMRHHTEASPEEMLEIVTLFDKNVKGKDINSYQSFEQFRDEVEDTPAPKRELERQGTQKIYEDDKYSIYRPLNTEASCKLGVNTKWCIAATRDLNQFDSYADNGSVHYVLTIKNLPATEPEHRVNYTFTDRSDYGGKAFSRETRDSPHYEISRNFILEIFDTLDKQITSDVVAAAICRASKEQNCQQEEERLYNIMLADQKKKIPSQYRDLEPGYLYDAWDDIRDIMNPENAKYYTDYDNEDFAGDLEDSFRQLFFTYYGNKERSQPSYTEPMFRKLLKMKNPHVNYYFKRVLTGGYGNYKSPVNDYIKKYFPDKFKKRLFASNFPPENIEESKIFSFNNDKKMFKLIK